MVCYSLYVMVLEMLMDFDIDQEPLSRLIPAHRLRYFSRFLSTDCVDITFATRARPSYMQSSRLFTPAITTSQTRLSTHKFFSTTGFFKSVVFSLCVFLLDT